MDKKKILVAGGLISFVICLFFAFMIISFSLNIISEIEGQKHFNSSSFSTTSFDNSTPEATAVSIARLNMGLNFDQVTVKDVYLTSDGKYWIVNFRAGGIEPYLVVTIDSETLMSKVNDDGWGSLDGLKAGYIAQIQSLGYPLRNAQKVTIEGKEIWKVPVVTEFENNGTEKTFKYIYVDVETGKSKNTLEHFNEAAGTDGWLTLKEVDAVINEDNMRPSKPKPFRDVLRDLYPE